MAGHRKLGQKLVYMNHERLGQKALNTQNFLGGKLSSLEANQYQNSYVPVKGDEPFLRHRGYSAFEKAVHRKHYA